MPKFRITIEIEVEADTARAAVEKLGERSAIPFAKAATATVVMMPNGNPQGGAGFLIPLGDPWDDKARAKALGYSVLGSGPHSMSWYVKRLGGASRAFNDWHMSEEAGWLAAIRHAKRNWPDAWKALG